MQRHGWMLVLVATLAACEAREAARFEAPDSAAAGDVPFRLVGPNGAALLVPVHVNGTGPHDFILDTGASMTCLDTALADELDLGGPDSRRARGTGVGGSGSVGIVRLDSLRVGVARAADLTACTVGLGALQRLGSPVRGLLGLNFLREFRLTVDFERGVVELVEP